MPCNPSDNNINVGPIIPIPPIPGFGIPTLPNPLSMPDIQLPTGIPEDLLSLVQALLANIPGGPLMGNITNFSKDVMDILASLLNQLGPYLSLYRFFQALLNIILCVIDILCSLMNPFALIRAMRRLFKRCLPDFINLFPWLALISMIVALLLLLLALIEYLINQIAQYISDIIQNILLLARVLSFQGSESDVIAAARKIAFLLCLIQQLFAILVAFQAILSIIGALANIKGRGSCATGSTSSTSDDNDCCQESSCPSFIKNNPDGFGYTTGQLIYHKQINQQLDPPFNTIVLPAARTESWQFTDLQIHEYKIADIITPIDGNIFWPEGMSYTTYSNLKKVPYTIDLKLSVDPAAFGHIDTLGKRSFYIQNCVLTIQPYFGVINYNGTYDSSKVNGTAQIQGGIVYNDDFTPYLINGSPTNLNGFIHQQPGTFIPTSEDGYFISNVEFILKPNHPALLNEGIITLGCVPSVSMEAEIVNVTTNISAPQLAAVADRIGALPDIQGTLDCLNAALAKFRQNVSVENAAVFQAEVNACLGGLKDQTISAYNAAIASGTSIFNSIVSISPSVQFVGLPVKLIVTLRDPSGTVISQRVPVESREEIAALITAEATFGTVSKFVYDGYQDFIAEIISTEDGSGEVTVSFDNNMISEVLGREDINAQTSVSPVVKTYRFVGGGVFAGQPGSGSQDAVPRRDIGDISRSNP